MRAVLPIRDEVEASPVLPALRHWLALTLVAALVANLGVQWFAVLPALRAVEERVGESERRAAQQRQVEERHQKLIEAAQRRQANAGAALLLQQEDNLRLARELNLKLKQVPRGEP